MPTASVNYSETVQWGAYQLPSWLFHPVKDKHTFDSPAASFSPDAALHNNPWLGLTSSHAALKPKTLILTVDIFRYQHSIHQWLALIHWLVQRGFVLYLTPVRSFNFDKQSRVVVSRAI